MKYNIDGTMSGQHSDHMELRNLNVIEISGIAEHKLVTILLDQEGIVVEVEDFKNNPEPEPQELVNLQWKEALDG